MEAVEFAGHQGLDNLILIYDSNDVTLDAMAAKTQSETPPRVLGDRLGRADDRRRSRPGRHSQGVQSREEGEVGATAAHHRQDIIGKGIPEVQGTSKGHAKVGRSSPTPRARDSACRRSSISLSATRCALILPDTSSAWSVPTDGGPGPTRLADRQSRQGGTARQRHDPAERRGVAHQGPLFPADAKLATRARAATCCSPGRGLPLLVSGSADLHGSTLNYIAADQDFDRTNRTGRNLRYGIREHAMAAINNGVAYDGLFRRRARLSSCLRIIAGRRCAWRRSRICRGVHLYPRFRWRG